MKTKLFFASLILFVCSVVAAEEFVYQGPWKTTNRKLDGEMTCVVTPIANHEWQGRFHGVWQGVGFDHTVKFTGPAKDLRGTATIDGATYNWRGWINKDQLKANFSGDRYSGSFDLKRTRSPHVARK